MISKDDTERLTSFLTSEHYTVLVFGLAGCSSRGQALFLLQLLVPLHPLDDCHSLTYLFSSTEAGISRHCCVEFVASVPLAFAAALILLCRVVFLLVT